jgi:putative effector of murein hydrolase
MLPKAVTTPIATSVAGQIGGVPALTAIVTIIGGFILGFELGKIRLRWSPAEKHFPKNRRRSAMTI